MMMTEIGLETPLGYVSVLPSRFLAFQMAVLLLASAGAMWSASQRQTVLVGVFASIMVVITLFGLFTSVEIKEGESNGR